VGPYIKQGDAADANGDGSHNGDAAQKPSGGEGGEGEEGGSSGDGGGGGGGVGGGGGGGVCDGEWLAAKGDVFGESGSRITSLDLGRAIWAVRFGPSWSKSWVVLSDSTLLPATPVLPHVFILQLHMESVDVSSGWEVSLPHWRTPPCRLCPPPPSLPCPPSLPRVIPGAGGAVAATDGGG
jgi:hypothetical protein